VEQANLDTTIHKTCHASTGEPIWCTLTITTEATSSIEFEWTGASDPGGAVFEPSSGSIAIGATPDVITVTPAACPSTVLFQDKNRSIQPAPVSTSAVRTSSVDPIHACTRAALMFGVWSLFAGPTRRTG
jgi:hypothetical protein